jgi:microcystin-dependent protein
VVAGDGISVNGSGSDRNPYVITNTLVDIETGIDVQVNNANVVTQVHGLDFRGAGVTVTPGTDEAVVTIPGPTGGLAEVPVPPGTIWMYGAATPPAGWLLCDGQVLLIADYSDLYAVIGTNFGGDGVTDFALPDLMDRFPIGASATRPINGDPGGAETQQVQVANLPPHTHTMNHDHPAVNSSSAGAHDHEVSLADNDGSASNVRRGAGGATWGAGPVANAGAHVHSVNVPAFVGNTGTTVNATGNPISIMPPWVAIGFIIRAVL